jgi:hypothetical protein
MSLEGPNIIKIGGGLGQQEPSDRNVGGLVIANGYAVATTFPLGATKELNSIDDAAALGLSAATDANAAGDTTACPWYHIDEFFRVNPDGKFYVHNGNAVAVADLFAVGGPADLLLAASGNSIRYMGLVFGFDPDATLVNTSGFAADVLTAVSAAQVWVNARAAENIYIDAVVVEGIDASTTPIDLKTLDAPQVLIATACDHGYFAEYDAAFLKTAAVGTVLGSIGVRMLSESIASVMLERYPSVARGQANYSLVDTRKKRWVSVGLSTGELVADVPDTRLRLMKKNAYCFADGFIGYQGIYFNSEATCTLVTDDFNTVHANRVWNESARRVRRALIPRMNSRVRIDPASGSIDPATIADWDAAAKRELEGMLAESEVADFRFTLDPAQDVIATGKVVCKLRIVPQGISKAIEAEIGFLNPAQA